ncbi:MAG: ATP-binding protein [Desulfuromonadaceae bacterium]|nr:ATP-binding protein [Desulfuromonadaceae bacterium]
MARLTLFKKILIITLLLSLLPLLASSLILFFNLESTSARLTSEIGGTADIQASESLQMRASQVAKNVADFLRQCESDLIFLSSSQLDQATLLSFYASRKGEIWYKTGTASAPLEIREQVPIYRSIALIDKTGQERVVIKDGIILPRKDLKNVSDPEQTEFRSEEYFTRVLKQPGKIYVSHLTGYHVSKTEQLNGADEPENAFEGKNYQGIIRFAAAIFDRRGTFNGAVVVSLDHRHLMEFSQHIDPGKRFSTVFPSYKSGNYAFIFDDEGWIITHPKYWDIRGVDQNGKLVPPYTEKSTAADINSGRIPFNLDYEGFIHPNYPLVAAEVRKHKAGFVDTTNVGGEKKIMAYAPIVYAGGDYDRYGVFGGVTIGFQLDRFQIAARKGSRLINQQLGEHRTRSSVIIVVTAILAGFSAWILSRGITRPLLQLTESAYKLAEGDTRNRVVINSSDEVGELARTFNIMADELEARKNNLLTTLEELQRSRMEILDERNFKASILESISSAIITISPSGILTSINGIGQKLFGNSNCYGMEYRDIFSEWPILLERINAVLELREGYGREPLTRVIHGEMTYYDVGIFPIGKDAEMGLTVTLRNETEREKLREEMMRLDRLASLGKLSTGIAHEVRNPLTGISLLLDDLHDRSALNADDKEMLSKALSEIERVERLMSALLNYSSPVRADFREGDLTRVLNDIILLMRRPAEVQGVHLNVSPGELPVFRFDPEKIKQALINIIKNAIEALDSGGTLTVTTRHQDDNVIITVHDSGPGINQQDLPLIFEPFFTRKGAGTGLGLSITQRIVEEHHGSITVESDSKDGTTFSIMLPSRHKET